MAQYNINKNSTEGRTYRSSDYYRSTTDTCSKSYTSKSRHDSSKVNSNLFKNESRKMSSKYDLASRDERTYPMKRSVPRDEDLIMAGSAWQSPRYRRSNVKRSMYSTRDNGLSGPMHWQVQNSSSGDTTGQRNWGSSRAPAQSSGTSSSNVQRYSKTSGQSNSKKSHTHSLQNKSESSRGGTSRASRATGSHMYSSGSKGSGLCSSGNDSQYMRSSGKYFSSYRSEPINNRSSTGIKSYSNNRCQSTDGLCDRTRSTRSKQQSGPYGTNTVTTCSSSMYKRDHGNVSSHNYNHKNYNHGTDRRSDALKKKSQSSIPTSHVVMSQTSHSNSICKSSPCLHNSMQKMGECKPSSNQASVDNLSLNYKSSWGFKSSVEHEHESPMHSTTHRTSLNSKSILNNSVSTGVWRSAAISEKPEEPKIDNRFYQMNQPNKMGSLSVDPGSSAFTTNITQASRRSFTNDNINSSAHQRFSESSFKDPSLWCSVNNQSTSEALPCVDQVLTQPDLPRPHQHSNCRSTPLGTGTESLHGPFENNAKTDPTIDVCIPETFSSSVKQDEFIEFQKNNPSFIDAMWSATQGMPFMQGMLPQGSPFFNLMNQQMMGVSPMGLPPGMMYMPQSSGMMPIGGGLMSQGLLPMHPSQQPQNEVSFSQSNIKTDSIQNAHSGISNTPTTGENALTSNQIMLGPWIDGLMPLAPPGHVLVPVIWPNFLLPPSEGGGLMMVMPPYMPQILPNMPSPELFSAMEYKMDSSADDLGSISSNMTYALTQALEPAKDLNAKASTAWEENPGMVSHSSSSAPTTSLSDKPEVTNIYMSGNSTSDVTNNFNSEYNTESSQTKHSTIYRSQDSSSEVADVQEAKLDSGAKLSHSQRSYTGLQDSCGFSSLGYENSLSDDVINNSYNTNDMNPASSGFQNNIIHWESDSISTNASPLAEKKAIVVPRLPATYLNIGNEAALPDSCSSMAKIYEGDITLSSDVYSCNSYIQSNQSEYQNKKDLSLSDSFNQKNSNFESTRKTQDRTTNLEVQPSSTSFINTNYDTSISVAALHDSSEPNSKRYSFSYQPQSNAIIGTNDPFSPNISISINTKNSDTPAELSSLDDLKPTLLSDSLNLSSAFQIPKIAESSLVKNQSFSANSSFNDSVPNTSTFRTDYVCDPLKAPSIRVNSTFSDPTVDSPKSVTNDELTCQSRGSVDKNSALASMSTYESFNTTEQGLQSPQKTDASILQQSSTTLSSSSSCRSSSSISTNLLPIDNRESNPISENIDDISYDINVKGIDVIPSSTDTTSENKTEGTISHSEASIENMGLTSSINPGSQASTPESGYYYKSDNSSYIDVSQPKSERTFQDQQNSVALPITNFHTNSVIATTSCQESLNNTQRASLDEKKQISKCRLSLGYEGTDASCLQSSSSLGYQKNLSQSSLLNSAYSSTRSYYGSPYGSIAQYQQPANKMSQSSHLNCNEINKNSGLENKLSISAVSSLDNIPQTSTVGNTDIAAMYYKNLIDSDYGKDRGYMYHQNYNVREESRFGTKPNYSISENEPKSSQMKSSLQLNAEYSSDLAMKNDMSSKSQTIATNIINDIKKKAPGFSENAQSAQSNHVNSFINKNGAYGVQSYSDMPSNMNTLRLSTNGDNSSRQFDINMVSYPMNNISSSQMMSSNCNSYLGASSSGQQALRQDSTGYYSNVTNHGRASTTNTQNQINSTTQSYKPVFHSNIDSTNKLDYNANIRASYGSTKPGNHQTTIEGQNRQLVPQTNRLNNNGQYNVNQTSIYQQDMTQNQAYPLADTRMKYNPLDSFCLHSGSNQNCTLQNISNSTVGNANTWQYNYVGSQVPLSTVDNGNRSTLEKSPNRTQDLSLQQGSDSMRMGDNDGRYKSTLPIKNQSTGLKGTTSISSSNMTKMNLSSLNNRSRHSDTRKQKRSDSPRSRCSKMHQTTGTRSNLSDHYRHSSVGRGSHGRNDTRKTINRDSSHSAVDRNRHNRSRLGRSSARGRRVPNRASNRKSRRDIGISGSSECGPTTSSNYNRTSDGHGRSSANGHTGENSSDIRLSDHRRTAHSPRDRRSKLNDETCSRSIQNLGHNSNMTYSNVRGHRISPKKRSRAQDVRGTKRSYGRDIPDSTVGGTFSNKQDRFQRRQRSISLTRRRWSPERNQENAIRLGTKIVPTNGQSTYNETYNTRFHMPSATDQFQHNQLYVSPQNYGTEEYHTTPQFWQHQFRSVPEEYTSTVPFTYTNWYENSTFDNQNFDNQLGTHRP